MGLNARQKRFVDEYLIDLNATQAAIRSGYSEKTAYSIGFENLRKPDIQKKIQESQKQLSEKSLWTREDSIKTMRKIIDKGTDSQDKDIIAAVKVINEMQGFNAPSKTENIHSGEALIFTRAAD